MGRQDFYIVGIGSSAGGYDALHDFFEKIPASPGISFVIIQHLSRDFKSLTSEWLAKITPMKIVTVHEDTQIEPDHVYLLPENMLLRVKDKKLVLEERGSDDIINLAVDVFFHSLAENFKERAIAIVLSGSGTDGSRGIRTIKEKGGLVIVQQPNSAEFDGMPSVAIATDHPDWILPPAEIAKKLLEFLNNPVNIEDDFIHTGKTTDREIVQDIVQQVSQYSTVNFQAYKINTIIRRIEKRTKLNHLGNIHEYREYLKHHPDEIHILYNDLLIGVTTFFRDPEAFRKLEDQVIPSLFEGKKAYETVRIWVVGCSTGEEAYSVGILCEEYVHKSNIEVPYKIFATDLDHRAIELASMGRFRNDIALDVSADRLDNFFNKVGDFYEIKKHLRKKVIFARHNLMNDPPFIKLDLITCRNLFIYFKPELQKKLLYNFNYSLKQEGFLFLGANESSDGLLDLFKPVDAKLKIFRNKADNHHRPHIFDQFSSFTPQQGGQSKNNNNKAFNQKDENDYESILINEYAPDSLFINENNEIVYSHGRIDKYLTLPTKRMNYDIFNMLNPNLTLIFTNGIRRINGGELFVSFENVSIQTGESKSEIEIRFKAIKSHSHKSQKHLTLVEFLKDKSKKIRKDSNDVWTEASFSKKEIEELEIELKLTKKELQFSVNELETLNEELQASNEEMHSSNEELQSTNEELQSSNEELHTVNNELKNKIDEIYSLHNDITNLFNNTDLTIVFLDQDLRIRKFTPASQENFNFIENDIGRPISHITHNFDYKNLTIDVKNVLENLTPIIKEVNNKNGQTFMARILPYKTEDMRIEGVVVTFVEISELKKVTNDLKQRTEELERSEQNLKSLVENTPDLIGRLNTQLQFIFVNKAIKNLFDVDVKDVIGKHPDEILLWDQKGRDVFVSCAQKAIEKESVVSEYINFIQDKNPVCFFVKFVPEFSLDEKSLESVLMISRDITDIKKHELTIEQKNETLKKMNVYLDNFIHIVAHDLRSPVGNLKLLMSLYYKTTDINKKIQLMDKIETAVVSLDNTLTGLMEIVELQNETLGNEKLIHFEKIIDKINIEYADKIKEKGIRLSVDFKECAEITYIEGYLLSIVKNLVSNAIKYYDENKEPEIKIKTQRREGYVLLMVQDNGIGIDLERHKDRIFMPFKRFTTKAEGKGIGLNITRTMVEKNGGKIEIESEVGKGTTFYVYLKDYLPLV